MSGRSEISLRMEKLRGDLSQSAFAKAVGISQSKISAYEAGTRRPGFKALTKLALYAAHQGRDDEAGWFADYSGGGIQVRAGAAILTVSNLLQKAYGSALFLDDYEFLPPHPLVPIGGKPAAMATFSLRVPKWFAPGDKQNFYVLATDDFVAPFRRGDLIVIDGSEKNPSELLESFVVAYRPNHFSDRERDKIERRLAEGLSSEEVKRRRDRRQFPFLRTGLFVGRLIRGENIGGTPAIEFRTANGNTLLEYLPGFLPASRKDKAIYTQYAELQILGRYVGWFSAPARGFPYVGKEKK